MEKNKTILQVHGQPVAHFTAKLVGTREGLEKLHKMLSQVVGDVKSTKIVREEFVASDQKPFALEIQMLPESSTDDLSLPYHSKPWDKESV